MFYFELTYHNDQMWKIAKYEQAKYYTTDITKIQNKIRILKLELDVDHSTNLIFIDLYGDVSLHTKIFYEMLLFVI